jgi:hypothetical protein
MKKKNLKKISPINYKASRALVLLSVLFNFWGCSSTKSISEDLPLPLAERQFMHICAPKEKLSENDLEEIAKTYNVKLNDILKQNEKCRPRQESSEIDLTISQCQVKKSEKCKTGLLKVPFF